MSGLTPRTQQPVVNVTIGELVVEASGRPSINLVEPLADQLASNGVPEAAAVAAAIVAQLPSTLVGWSP